MEPTPEQALDVIRRARADRDLAEQAFTLASTRFRVALVRAQDAGVRTGEIATAAGLSKQRVRHHLALRD